ncbi:MAG: hypothetical protein RL660_704 [Bacteroidota bacterium]
MMTMIVAANAYARRVSPAVVADGMYVINKNYSLKNTTVKASNDIQYTRSTGSLKYMCGDYTYTTQCNFSTKGEFKVGKGTVKKTKQSKAHPDNAAALSMIAAMKKCNRYKKVGDTLNLYQGTKLMLSAYFVPPPSEQRTTPIILKKDQATDAPMSSSKYRIIMQMENGTMVERNMIETSLELNGDNFTAYTGCNRMGGSLVRSRSTIKFDQLLSTKMACDGPSSDAENGLVENLRLARKMRIEGNKAYLEDEAGNLLVMLEQVTE